MKKTLLAVALLASLQAGAQTGAYNDQALAYIRKYKDLAISEQRRSGVPAAITLAQGIHETQAGNSELATEANNHFGIKCKKTWQGETYAHTDDAPNECFRKYSKAIDSYRDHSDYLRNSTRYQSCFSLEATDYAGWATELKKCGYATNPRYAQKLIRIVEDFHLQDYTYAALDKSNTDAAPVYVAAEGGEGARTREEVARAERRSEQQRADEIIPDNETPAQAPPPPPVREVVRETPVVAETIVTEEAVVTAEPEPMPVYGQAVIRNGAKGFYAHKGDVLLEYAIKYNMRYARLLELNELPDAPLADDMFVYLEKKKGTTVRSMHKAQPGETIAASNTARTYHHTETQEPQPQELIATGNKKPAAEVIEEEEEEPVAAAPVIKKTETPKPVVTAPQRDVQLTQAREMPPVKKEPVEEKPVPVIVKKATPPPAPRPAARPVAKTFTIADEVAVEEIGKPQTYSPRYVATTTSAPQTTMSDKADEEATPAPKEPEQPKDEFSKLKAQLDKAVYAPAKPARATMTVVEEKPKYLADATPAAPAPSSSGSSYHVVKNGDTAYSIAKQYNISMKQLMDMNHLNFEAIRVGQKLRVK